MSDRPILFSAPMVRALLREVEAPGTGKTNTRRILKPQPFIDRMGNFCSPNEGGSFSNWGQNINGTPCLRNFIKSKVRFAPGDRLWVREAHMLADRSKGFDVTHWNPGVTVGYLADGEGEWVDRALAAGCRKRPSIHLPRYASRLTLVVTEVRVERLQDISEADAVAEGIKRFGDMFSVEKIGGHNAGGTTAPAAFALLWNDINGPGAWAANPWVSATTFTVHGCNIDAMRSEAA
jgi:hypothetical protein